MLERASWVLLVLLLPGLGDGQQADPVTEPVPTVLHVSSKLVLLDALVTEKKTGRWQSGLTLDDFALEEDGVPQKLRYFSHDELPLSIVMLFDLTGTVQPELKQLGDGAAEILKHLKLEDEVAVLTFSSATQVLENFTTDRELAASAIRKAAESSTKEGTFIDEDVFEAIDVAMHSTVPGSRRVLLWFTDGTADNVSPVSRRLFGKHAPAVLHTRAEATEKLMRSGVVCPRSSTAPWQAMR